MDKIVKPGIVLCIISVVAAAILSIAYEATYDAIQLQEEKIKNAAMQEVLADATDFEDLGLSSDEVSSVFAGSKDGDVIGYAIFTAPKGYAGPVEMLTGVDTEGNITGISIISSEETPGLGANASKDSFKDQYVGKSGVLSVTKSQNANDNEIVAMTSATITTKAVTEGVNQALEFYESNIREVK